VGENRRRKAQIFSRTKEGGGQGWLALIPLKAGQLIWERRDETMKNEKRKPLLDPGDSAGSRKLKDPGGMN